MARDGDGAGESKSGAGGPHALTSDRPVRYSVEDRFRRTEFAKVVARYVGSAPEGESMVFSLNGAWGAGKTSVLHLVEEQLDAHSVEVVWFNPWLFSGAEQITSQFMRELGLQLNSKERDLGRVGELIKSYGKVLEVGGAMFSGALKAFGPLGTLVAGAAEAGAASAFGEALQTAERESVRETRDRIENALREAGRRIVVFIDDIDRLDSEEIRAVFKLVRLVADFPNVTYLLSFDRPRVESALGQVDLTGRAYLAKIVQASFDLPPLDPGILNSLLPDELNRRLSGRTTGPLHQSEWNELFVRVVRPLVRYPRDVGRYLNAVVPAVEMLGEEVALEDVLALEAIRVFLPDVYDALPEYADVLAMGKHGLTPDHRDKAADRLTEFIAIDRRAKRVVRELCSHLFPMSQMFLSNYLYDGSSLRGWRKERRVASAEVLNVYLERGVRPGAAQASVVRRLIAVFDDEVAVSEILQGLPADELESTLSRLRDHASELADTGFENGIAAVLEVADRLRRGRSHPFDPGADGVVTGLVLLTLQAIEDPDVRLSRLRTIVERTRSISWRGKIVRLAHPEGGDEPLIAKDAAMEMLDDLKNEVLGSPPEWFEQEREPHLVALIARDEPTGTYDSRLQLFLKHTGFFRAMLAGLVSEHMNWPIGSATFEKKPSLDWAFLKKIAGGEDELLSLLRAAVDAGSAPEGNARLVTALGLAADVLAGRRKMIGPRERVLNDEDDEVGGE